MIDIRQIGVDILGEELFESASEKAERQKLQKEYEDQEITLTPEQQDFVDKKLSSKLWRLDNLYTKKNKDGKKIKFKLNESQKKVLSVKENNKKAQNRGWGVNDEANIDNH